MESNVCRCASSRAGALQMNPPGPISYLLMRCTNLILLGMIYTKFLCMKLYGSIKLMHNGKFKTNPLIFTMVKEVIIVTINMMPHDI